MSLHHSTLTYEPQPKVSETNPGIVPMEFNVLVLPRVSQRQRASGIFVPENAAQREEEGGDEGLLIAVAPRAFEELGTTPEVGQHVMFARYAGKSFVGADGRVYRLMKDKEILGVRTAGANAAKVAA